MGNAGTLAQLSKKRLEDICALYVKTLQNVITQVKSVVTIARGDSQARRASRGEIAKKEIKSPEGSDSNDHDKDSSDDVRHPLANFSVGRFSMKAPWTFSNSSPPLPFAPLAMYVRLRFLSPA